MGTRDMEANSPAGGGKQNHCTNTNRNTTYMFKEGRYGKLNQKSMSQYHFYSLAMERALFWIFEKID